MGNGNGGSSSLGFYNSSSNTNNNNINNNYGSNLSGININNPNGVGITSSKVSKRSSNNRFSANLVHNGTGNILNDFLSNKTPSTSNHNDLSKLDYLSNNAVGAINGNGYNNLGQAVGNLFPA